MGDGMDDWFEKMRAKALDRHVAERVEGLHDDRCEWYIKFPFCHCHRRARLAKGMTEAPVLVFEDPTCDGCGEPAEHTGDGWECRRCRVYFGDRYDEPGEWQDVHAATDEELAAQSLAARERRSVSS